MTALSELTQTNHNIQVICGFEPLPMRSISKEKAPSFSDNTTANSVILIGQWPCRALQIPGARLGKKAHAF